MADERQDIDDPSPLHPLLREWQRIQLLRQRQEELVQNREKLHEQILQLQSSLDEMTSQYHQGKPSASFEKLEQRRSLLDSVKRKQHEIDHQLDEMEEATEEKLRLCEERVVQRKNDPRVEKEYFSFRQILEQSFHNLRDLQLLEQSSQEIHEMLEKIAGIREALYRRGILDYLFGMSPTYSLYRARQTFHEKIQKTAQILYPRLQAHRGDIASLIHQFLEDLQSLSKCGDGRWNFRWIEQSLKPHRRTFERWIGICHEKLQTEERLINDTEEKIRKCLFSQVERF